MRGFRKRLIAQRQPHQTELGLWGAAATGGRAGVLRQQPGRGTASRSTSKARAGRNARRTRSSAARVKIGAPCAVRAQRRGRRGARQQGPSSSRRGPGAHRRSPGPRPARRPPRCGRGAGPNLPPHQPSQTLFVTWRLPPVRPRTAQPCSRCQRFRCRRVAPGDGYASSGNSNSSASFWRVGHPARECPVDEGPCVREARVAALSVCSARATPRRRPARRTNHPRSFKSSRWSSAATSATAS